MESRVSFLAQVLTIYTVLDWADEADAATANTSEEAAVLLVVFNDVSFLQEANTMRAPERASKILCELILVFMKIDLAFKKR